MHLARGSGKRRRLTQGWHATAPNGEHFNPTWSHARLWTWQTTSAALMMEKPEEAYVDDSSPNSVSPEQSRDLEHVYLARTNSGEALNPQPSNDPEDPLNWPLSLKVSLHPFASATEQKLRNGRLAS
jgi:hypothetical protein